MSNATDSDSSVPYNKHDILGYVAPSIVVCIGMYLFARSSPYWKIKLSNLILDIEKIIPYKETIEEPYHWAIVVTYSIIFSLAIYIRGHLISIFGHLIFDRLLMARCLGFPYEWILFSTEVVKELRKKINTELEKHPLKGESHCAACKQYFGSSSKDSIRRSSLTIITERDRIVFARKITIAVSSLGFLCFIFYFLSKTQPIFMVFFWICFAIACSIIVIKICWFEKKTNEWKMFSDG
jgi:hypothetical protein